MNTVVDRYVVFGNPVAHSLSPQIHAQFAQQTGQQLTYERQLAPHDGFAAAAREFFSSGGAGANVTVPFKQDAAEWVSGLDPAAAFAGAVNTIVPEQFPDPADAGRRYIGYNTDGLGLLADLRRGLGETSLAGARILILGAGGAVRGVLAPLAQEGPAEMIIANRTVLTAQALAESLAAHCPGVTVAGVGLEAVGHRAEVEINSASTSNAAVQPGESVYDIVINGTSAGLDGGVPAVSGDCVKAAFCYDMVYGASTAFCQWAAANGAAETRDGLGMLVEQAAAAFTLWRGVIPDPAPVLRQLRRTISDE